MAPFLVRVLLWQMPGLASLELSPLQTWRAAVISDCIFSQPKKESHGLREVPNVWKYGPLPRCTQALMSLAPVEAKAAVQTHHPFKAYLVPSKKMLPIDKRIGSSACSVEPLPSVPPVSFLHTGPKDTLPNATFYSRPREIPCHLVQRGNH